MQRQTLA